MKSTEGRRMLGATALVAGLLLAGTAGAWYGDPWYRPYGSGAVTYERQNMMRGHAYAMQELADMLDGRRAFNRDEAVRLARDLEKNFGDELIRNFAPGTVVAGSRTAPGTWRNFGAFKGYADAAQQASGRLADVLAKQPSSQDTRPGPANVPPRGMGYGRWGRLPYDQVSVEVMQEYGRLNATCQSCHAWFRGPRR